MIPAEAVEAARVVAFERYGTKPDAAYIKTLLAAAAPHMMGTAWEQGFDAGPCDANPYTELGTNAV